MQINNPLQINDWEIKKFFKIVLVIQLMMWGAIGLDAIGLQIPIIRQFIGFIYLAFIPGIILLRILRLHKLGNIETIVYAVGLSLATLMFTGFFMNMIYPFFGITEPISLTPLVSTISVIVLLLCILGYMRDKDYSDPAPIELMDIMSPPVLFLCLVPFLAVFGTYLMNFYQNSAVLMSLIVVIALIPLLIGFDKFIPKNMYSLAVFVIAIALLLHQSLITQHIWGWDIHHEYYISGLVMENSYWDLTIPKSTNAMLSIVMLLPIFSKIGDIDPVWIFKIVYPLLFSLIPLGLYRIFQRQTNDKIAFLSSFFFMSFLFYAEMLQLARQQIAEFFVVLLMLIMIDKDMDKMRRSFLFIVFGISLVVSHYGLSYIYMFSLVSVGIILVFAENHVMQEKINKFYTNFSRYKNKSAVNPSPSDTNDRSISLGFVLLFVVFTLSWYMYISGSSAIESIVRAGNHIGSNIFTDFLNPEAAQGADIIIKETASPLHSVTKYLHLITQFFILVGVLRLLMKRSEMKFEREYAAFSYVNFVICLAGIAVPYFASSLNTTRLYQITLLFLAPFCVIGGVTFFKGLSKIAKISWTDKSMANSFKVLSVFLSIFLLFNIGFIYEITDDNPSSISLNNEIDYPRFNEQEVLGAKWLFGVKNSNLAYADAYRWMLLGSFNWWTARCLPKNVDGIPDDPYTYLGSYNIITKSVLVAEEKYINSSDVTSNRNMIYMNGGAEIYR